MISLTVPYRGVTIDRRVAFHIVTDWWKTNFPSLELRPYDSGHESFNRAATRNLAVKESKPGTVIICDADTIPEKAAVEEALAQATDGVMHIPFTAFHQLTREATLAALIGEDTTVYRPELISSASVGGVMVIDRDAYLSIGGQDERFASWGSEDTAFAHAADTLLGRTMRHTGVALGFWHPLDPTRAVQRLQPPRKALEAQYRSARGNPDAMRKLIGI